jgi:hypothetical protein
MNNASPRRRFWRLLDAASWLGARPRLFLPFGFACIWLGVTMGLQFIARPNGDATRDTTLSWSSSVGYAFFVAIVGTTLTYFLYFRRSG